MWNWFNCYLSGRHQYGMWCEPGTIFLRCVHCGRRSSGWALDGSAANSPAAKVQAKATEKKSMAASSGPPKRILPFDRRVAS